MNKILLFAIINFIIIENVWCEVRRDDKVRQQPSYNSTQKITNALKLLKQMSDKSELIVFFGRFRWKIARHSWLFSSLPLALSLSLLLCWHFFSREVILADDIDDSIIDIGSIWLPENFQSHYISTISLFIWQTSMNPPFYRSFFYDFFSNLISQFLFLVFCFTARSFCMLCAQLNASVFYHFYWWCCFFFLFVCNLYHFWNLKVSAASTFSQMEAHARHLRWKNRNLRR